MKSFGETLRKIREERKLYLKNISEKMNWSVVYLSDIERGNRKPPAKKDIIKLSKILDINPSRLLNLADKEKGVIELDLKSLKRQHSETALCLARQIETFQDDDWEELNNFLKKKGVDRKRDE